MTSSSAKKCILIVEDDEDFQSLYIDIIKPELDVDILQAYNGVEGLVMVDKRKPDLIILDILMPVMDGEQFFRALRQERQIHDVPIIIASVNDKAGDQLARNDNIRAVFKKPFSYQIFLSKIREILNL